MKRITRVLFIAALSLSFAVMIGWAAQLKPGSARSVLKADTKTERTIAAARAALEQAQAKEKASPGKASALALENALTVYNAAVAMPEQLQPAPVSATPIIAQESEPNDTSATANALNLGIQPCAIVSAAINPGGDLDYFSFAAPAGSKAWIYADSGGAQNTGANSRDTVIDLLAADGSTVIENDDDDGTGNGCDGVTESILASAISGRTLIEGGAYFIRVKEFSKGVINPYKLFVVITNTAATEEVEPNDTAATANSIPAQGQPVGFRSGAISPEADADYYSMNLTAGNIVYINADADPERDGTGPDLVVELRDPADALLLSLDSSIMGSVSNPAAESACFAIGASGTYFIKVRHFSNGGTGTYNLMVAACNSDAACVPSPCPCSLTCPADIARANDPNQCGAIITFPPPPPGPCGIASCSPASGSFFPQGITTVTCFTTAGPTCSFTVTINDTQPPVITCPANVTAVTPTATDPCAVVTFTTTASDNCPGVTVVCNPPSGSCFPTGVTTVTCTATDASGNTATCSFTVSVFNGRLQDDSEGCNNTVIFNTITGDYRWCCHGTIFTGRAKVTRSGNTFTLEHNPADRRVLIKLSAGSFPPSGNASLQSPVGTIKCLIQDRDTRNDTCACGGAAVAPSGQ